MQPINVSVVQALASVFRKHCPGTVSEAQIMAELAPAHLAQDWRATVLQMAEHCLTSGRLHEDAADARLAIHLVGVPDAAPRAVMADVTVSGSNR